MASTTFWRQFKALNKKNYIIFRRNRRAIICEFVIPILFASLFVILGTQIPASEVREGSDVFYRSGYMIEPFIKRLGQGSTVAAQEPEYASIEVDPGWVGAGKDLAFIQSKEKLADVETFLQDDRGITLTKEFDNFNDPRNEIRRDGDDTRLAGALEVNLLADNKIQVNVMSKEFKSEGFAGFSLNNSETYDIYEANLEFERSLTGNYAQFALEAHLNKTKPQNRNVKISNVFTYRSTEDEDISVLAQVMDSLFPILVVVTYTLPMLYIIQRAVEEKASKTRESMRMMGMKEAPYWCSWFLVYFCLIFIISLIMALGTGFTVLNHSNFLLVFLIFFLYGASVFGMGILVIAVFDSVKTATIAGMCLNLFIYYIRYALPDSTPLIVRIIVSVFPSLNLYNVQTPLWQLQFLGGVSFSNTSTFYGQYSLLVFFLMSVFNIFFWTFLALYIAAIIPTEFGTRKHPCFCLMFRRRRVRVNENGERYSLLLQNNSDDAADIEYHENSDAFEKVGNDLKELERTQECLKIRGLQKTFGNGFQAVDNLSLTMYSGQIFALLGHNGAGKTTTISMLTGLFGASGGNAEAFGIDLLNNQDEARSIMGVCPQHNVLFPTLTPEEHFEIFCEFKGVPASQKRQAIEDCLRNVDLLDKRHDVSKDLSGGQKRKVNVGIALLGGSKIVLLDEPTSGMDPTARRRLWDLLKENKEDRIIILTTHFMEEADILGDRISIMAKGSAQCCGSSLFLKRKFGVGYNLTFDKSTQESVPKLEEYVMGKIPEAIKLSEVSSEVTFQLPNSSVNKFKTFFEGIDNNLEELQIKSYGIGVTTLEEVFLKVGDGVDEKEKFDSKEARMSEEEKENDAYCLVDQSVQGFSLDILQLIAMMKIRIKFAYREPRILICEVILPILMVILSAVLMGVSLREKTGIFQYDIGKIPDNLITHVGYPQTAVSQEVAQQFIDYQYTKDGFNAKLFEGDAFVGENRKETAKNFDEFVMSNQIDGWRIFSVFINRIEVDPEENTVYYDLTTLVDPTQAEAVGYAAQAAMTSIFRAELQDETAEFTIGRGSFPRIGNTSAILRMVLAGITVVNFCIALGLTTSSMAGNIAKERTDSLKHQQIVSGGSKFSYWMAMFIVDFGKLLPAFISFIIIVIVLDVNIPFFYVFAILCLISILPCTYFLTFIFRTESFARNFVRLIHFFGGGICAFICFGFSFAGQPWTSFSIAIRVILCWNTSFSFSHAIIFILAIENIPNFKDENKFSLKYAGADFICLVAQIIFFWVAIMLIENRFYINRNGRAVRVGDFVGHGEHGGQERVNLDDPDVKEEEQRIAASTPDDMEIRTYLLNKIYKTRKGENHAVRNVSFGISFGECFALLGINGAGKTSTFKALTGDVDPTSGEVHVGGYDVQNRIQYNHIRKLIGYCPQFDAIFPNLTVKEHLEFYANIKGVIPNMRRTVVERQLIEMGLEEYTNKQAGKLSGGNKRKLSVAMAMIGNPPIVFLDEPSTGMDPKAKRFMWNIIAKISTLRKKSCVILTTHSMEEAEALSTKLGIMVGGSFKCYGSAQHIKNKFGDGYEVEIKITTPTSEELTVLGTGKGFQEEMLVDGSNYMQILSAFEAQPLSEEIKEGGFGENMWKEFGKGGVKLRNFIEFIFIEQTGLSLMNQLANDFEYVELLEHYGNSFRVKLPTFNQSIGVLFGRFEEIYKPQFSIDQYSVSQTTLEQIFNNFAKQHYTLSKTSRVFRRQS